MAWPYEASPREVASYLVSIKPLVARAVQERQRWVRELGLLLEEARSGNAAQVAARAGRLGREHIDAFRDTQLAAQRSRAPDGCAGIRDAVVEWTSGLVRACESLVEVGTGGQLGGLKTVQEHAAEARHAAQRFNAGYMRVVDELHAEVRLVERRRARRSAGAASASAA